MYAPTDNVPPSRSALMRFLVRSREYRHPHVWVRVRLRDLQPRPCRPFPGFRPVDRALCLAGSAAAGGRGADLLDRLPPADQCPELAWEHLPVAGSINSRPAWGDASALRLRSRPLVFCVLRAAAKISCEEPPVIGQWPSRPGAAHVEQAAGARSRREFRPDTRAQKHEECDGQQCHPGD